MAIAFVCLTVISLIAVIAAFLAGVRIASTEPDSSMTPEDDAMSKVTDAFAAYVAFRDQKEADAVAAAVAAEQGNHQAEIDAATAAGAQAESDEDVAVIAGAMPAPEPALEG